MANHPTDVIGSYKKIVEECIIKNPYIDKMGGSFPSAKQLEFLLYMGLEGLYGGPAGSGKSITNLAAALMFIEFPDYHAIIFGQTYTQMERAEGIIQKSMSWLKNKECSYDQTAHRWTWPSGNTLQFGCLNSENDKYDYKGSRFNSYHFEELTMLHESNYLYFFSRPRVQKSPIPMRYRSTTNPDGLHCEWVQDRFWKQPNTPERVYFGSKLTDNPAVDIDTIKRGADNLDPLTRAQLFDGELGLKAEGRMFLREHYRFIPQIEPSHIVMGVRSWDLAATTPSLTNPKPDCTAGVLWYLLRNGMIVLADLKWIRGSPAEVADLVRDTAETDTTRVDVLIEQERGSAGKIVIDHYQRNILPNHVVLPFLPTGSKEVRAAPMAECMANGRIRVLSTPSVNPLLEQLVFFPTNSVHDDFVDAASAGFQYIMGGGTSTEAYIPPAELIDRRVF